MVRSAIGSTASDRAARVRTATAYGGSLGSSITPTSWRSAPRVPVLPAMRTDRYGNPARSQWLDIALPVDQALAHITLILIAMTNMYLSARAATDAKHWADFIDPLLDDLRATLALHRTAAAKRYPL